MLHSTSYYILSIKLLAENLEVLIERRVLNIIKAFFFFNTTGGVM